MKTLSEAIADRGLVEAVEIKKYMRSLKARAQSTKGRHIPKGLENDPQAYIAKFIADNHLTK